MYSKYMKTRNCRTFKCIGSFRYKKLGGEKIGIMQLLQFEEIERKNKKGAPGKGPEQKAITGKTANIGITKKQVENLATQKK